MRLNGTALVAGDGAAVANETQLELVGEPPGAGGNEYAELLLFDLA